MPPDGPEQPAGSDQRRFAFAPPIGEKWVNNPGNQCWAIVVLVGLASLPGALDVFGNMEGKSHALRLKLVAVVKQLRGIDPTQRARNAQHGIQCMFQDGSEGGRGPGQLSFLDEAYTGTTQQCASDLITKLSSAGAFHDSDVRVNVTFVCPVQGCPAPSGVDDAANLLLRAPDAVEWLESGRTMQLLLDHVLTHRQGTSVCEVGRVVVDGKIVIAGCPDNRAFDSEHPARGRLALL